MHNGAGPDLARRASAPSVEASFYGWLLGGFEYKITIDFTGGHQNESMLADLFRVLLTSFQPPGRSPEEVVRPASHALPTPSWESIQRKIVIDPMPGTPLVIYAQGFGRDK